VYFLPHAVRIFILREVDFCMTEFLNYFLE